MTRFSIAIPCYEAQGLGYAFLHNQLSILSNQTFKDFEVVISDHTKDNNNNLILETIQEFSTLNIRYIRNTQNRGSSSANINFAMDHCSGELIKILFQDDFLYNDKSLEIISNNFEEKDNWLVTGCCHYDGVVFKRPFFPEWNDNIHLGVNTISSPSVLTIRNSSKLYFDNDLIWMMDVDLYKKYYLKFGPPKIVNEIVVVNRICFSQLTNFISNETKQLELTKMMERYYDK
jgi:GT2 family glycosyltransferase